jgi:predicted DNA-binding protein (MmcQ/YjbR family)
MARPRRPARPPAKPTRSAAKPSAKPAEVARRPAKPSAKPTKLAKTPAKPSGNPANAAAKPAKTAAKLPAKAPAKPSSHPANAAAKPANAAAKPANAAAKLPAKTAPRSGSSPGAGLLAIESQLRDHAMAKPAATEHFPWGERAIKVKGKVFLFMRADAQQLSLSTKLPRSGSVALLLPFATPTGYGLGKAGWVSAAFSAPEQPPVEMLCAWIDESYQAVAPAKLAALARTED